MTTPVDERPEPNFVEPRYSFSDVRRSQDGSHRSRSGQRASLPSYNVNHRREDVASGPDRSSDEEGTVIGDVEATNKVPASDHVEDHPRARPRAGSHLTVQTAEVYDHGDNLRSIPSASQTREQSHRLEDELEMLKIERQVSRRAESEAMSKVRSGEEADLYRSRSRRNRPGEMVDEFDVATNPVHEQTQLYKPLEHPVSGFGKFVRRIHKSNWLVRYITYITPPVLILLIPLLLGAIKYKNATVGGVYLSWFMIWLEIVWLTLWAGRILAKCLPWPIGVVSSLFTNNSKKWRDMGKQLELPATLFFWWLAIEVSFLPTMLHHQKNHGASDTQEWMSTTNKVLVSLFVAAILNFVEKIIIQLIAISFHLRTYADRIEINKFQIGSLTKLYKFSKEKIAMEDYEFEQRDTNGPPSGARTPGRIVNDAAKTTKEAFTKFGDIAGKVAGDFTGKQTAISTHPSQVILALLGSTSGSQVLARRLYRTFAREETETVYSEDLRSAFETDEEADAAFSMFDKDMNGDISMEELEAVCVEIGRERKSITASLKDLDSVVSKLDDIFMFIVLIIVILVFISLISASAGTAIASAGSAVLALSWLFSATAQELLQSIIFVFVKHPFDVGDRVTIYGNTGAVGRGDDYFVKEISLLYTEFKKMEGHVVQAPNSYLNTLFILNQRRSGGLAEAVSITIKFGTTLEQIDGLRTKLLEFVKSEKREYQGNILTELRDIVEVHSMNLNVVFFYKSNWQNEGLRLARRNKFICAMMVTMQELGIEGPYMRFPGMKQSFPMYLSNIPHMPVEGSGYGGHPDMPGGYQTADQQGQDGGAQDPPFVTPISPRDDTTGFGSLPRLRTGSILKPSRPRGESLSAMNRRVDFSLGMNRFAADDLSGDVYADRERSRVPIEVTEASRSRARAEARHSLERERASVEMARSTSRDMPFSAGGLARRSTDGSTRWARGNSIHRNRFFGRGRDMTDEQRNLEQGNNVPMADIPENPATARGSPTGAVHQTIDPRTGLVDSRGWRSTSRVPGRVSFEQGGFPGSEMGHTHSFTSNDEAEMRRL